MLENQHLHHFAKDQNLDLTNVDLLKQTRLNDTHFKSVNAPAIRRTLPWGSKCLSWCKLDRLYRGEFLKMHLLIDLQSVGMEIPWDAPPPRSPIYFGDLWGGASQGTSLCTYSDTNLHTVILEVTGQSHGVTIPKAKRKYRTDTFSYDNKCQHTHSFIPTWSEDAAH
jgi:hypothetical protein